jgi:hypothetical protein
MLGKLRNLNVCPVGAVSKIITSKSIFSIVLNYTLSTQPAARRTLPHRFQALSWLFPREDFGSLRRCLGPEYCLKGIGH